MSKQLNMKPSAEIVEFYETYFKMFGQAGGYILTALPDIIRKTIQQDIKGNFSDKELCLIVEAFEGMKLLPQIAGGHIYNRCRNAIELSNAYIKWIPNADPQDIQFFLQKLHDMPEVMRFILEIWACGYWQGNQNRKKKIEDWVK